jgi:hypothetical protein
MPVVINEFEVVPVAEPSPESSAATGTKKPPATAAQPSPQETTRVLRRVFDRAMRLRAH